ncbi:hypothetical protein QJS10_CPB21g01682 [Acorus calamus]|uniref:Uncharacterized protein n=1 Tax=Acorus calamus TaxID=4465 RepID=A0AAV9C629_ACOCL|nr:hypothetical protein QJS10_CPB21g01682 [Acorus calamus]
MDFILLPDMIGSQDLWIVVGPPSFNYDLDSEQLNGLEIFKMNNTGESFTRLSLQAEKKHIRHFLAIAIGVPGSLLLIILLAVMAFRHWAMCCGNFAQY